MGSIDTRLGRIETLLRLTQEIGRINSLENLADSQRHRRTINELWGAIQADLAPISQAIKDLPALPDVKTMQWAQSVLAMRDLRFMELDTTGVEPEDEIIRFTLLDSSENVIEDFLIKTTRPISEKATQANGITQSMLEEGIDIAEAWERMQAALIGYYIISYAQKWDLDQLNAMATRHNLDPITVIGEDLQRRCTQYYNGEYYLNLPNLAERAGYAMPEPTSVYRAIAQIRVLVGMASAVTDVRPPQPPASTKTDTSGTESDDLGNLDDHPF